MVDDFQNLDTSIHGHDTDNSSMNLAVGSDSIKTTPLFLQNKAGIPHVTNWDDSINSISKTDKAHFVDQQEDSCGSPKDIVILDDICAVGYPNHNAAIKTEMDISGPAFQTYVEDSSIDILCSSGGVLQFGDETEGPYYLMFGIIFDYTLATPELNDNLGESQDEHTYFYDTYLKLTYGGDTSYHSFGGFITSAEYQMIYDTERQVCEENNTWLNGPDDQWYYLTDVNKVALSKELFTLDTETYSNLSDYNGIAGNGVSFNTPYAYNSDEGGCSVCGENYICETCASSSVVKAIQEEVTAKLIKKTTFEDCGKVDVYYKKSGKIEAYNNNEITSTNHNLSNYDILKVSGEFGDGNLVSDMNGVVYIKVVDSNTFTIFNDPRTDEAGSVEDFSVEPGTVTDLGSFRWTCVGNAQKEEFQSWFYYGSYGGYNGMNGYGLDLPTVNYGGNYDVTLTVSEWDSLIPTTTTTFNDFSGAFALNFKASSDYPAKEYFGYSLDINKVVTGTESLYMLSVGGTGGSVVFNRVDTPDKRQTIIPATAPSGGVTCFRLDVDSNHQINSVSSGGRVRANSQPWVNVESQISSFNNLLINPVGIISSIDVADDSVSETYWLNHADKPTPSGVSRAYVWSDEFGKTNGISNLRDDVSDIVDVALSLTAGGTLYHQMGFLSFDFTGTSQLNNLTFSIAQQIYDGLLNKDGIVQFRDKLVIGRGDGIYIYTYSNPVDSSDDHFTRIDTISTPSDTTNAAFGNYIAHYDEYVLTNSRSNINEFGNETSQDVDYIYLYKQQTGLKHRLLQKISPCIKRTDDFYADLSLSEFSSLGLVGVGNLSYGGESENTYTWVDLDLAGRYDIYKNKIIFRDPLEYVVFKDNWNTEIKRPLSGSVSPENYFFFRERYNSEGTEVEIPCDNPPCPTTTNYVNYSYDSNFDGSISVVESYYRHDTLVLFFDIPRFQGYINVYNSLNVRLTIDRNDNQDDAPMLKFYGVDPRDTISSTSALPITDGACDSETSYDLGNYNSGNFTLEDDGTYTVDIDIPASVFLDGLIEGDATDASDKNQDSYNNTGSVNKTLAMGIKIRRRQTGGIDCYTVDGNRLNAGNFYESNAQIEDVTLRLSYSLYEEKSLRRFDLASRELAILNTTEVSNSNSVNSSVLEELDRVCQIRIGNSLSNSYVDRGEAEIRKGMFSESLQIFDSHSVSISDAFLDTDGNLTTTGSSDTYKSKITTASLDVHRPEFMSMFTLSNLTDSGNMPLYMQGHIPSTGGIILHSNGIESSNGNFPLYIGPLTNNNNLDLSIPSTYGSKNGFMPLVGPKLKGFDAPPNDVNLTISGPDSSGGVDLFQQAPLPATGNMNLVTVGPLQNTGNLPLYTDAHRDFNTSIGRPPLYMAGMIPDNSGIPLHINRDSDTGDLPLVINGPLPDSGNLDLYLLSPFTNSLNLSMPETKGGSSSDMSLVMFDYRKDDNLNLSVFGPTSDSSETTLFTKYSPVNVNNIDDSPHVPCFLDGPDYEFDKTDNSENLIDSHNSITNEEETNGLGFNEIENSSGYKMLGETVRDSNSDSEISKAFFSEDVVRAAYDGNSSIFAVAQNTSVYNSPQGVVGLIVYDVSNGSIDNKRLINKWSSIDSTIYIPTAKIYYKDVAVSSSGRIAFSAFARYSDGFSLKSREYLVILDSSLSVEKVVSSVVSSGAVTADDDKRLGDSIAWDGEDLYYSEQTSIFGRVKKLSSSDNYTVSSVVVEFEDTDDYANYNNNLGFNQNLKAGFGYKIVLTDSKLIVSAPLLDPYLSKNTITSYVPYSPRGAVYLFNRSGDTFTYDSAIYSGGITSADITPLSFSGTTTTFSTTYFGYSVDYSEASQKLIIGEPGYGNGITNGGYGRVYTFGTGNVPSLIRTSNPTTTVNNSLFGLFVELCDGYTELVLSREANGKIYNINTSAEYAFDSDSTNDEVLQYVPASQTLISASEEIHVMKLVSLGTDKMVVGRRFDYDYGFTSETLFKLTSINSGKPANLSLFINTVDEDSSDMPLSMVANQPGYLNLTLPKLGDNNSVNLSIRVPEPDSGSMNLHMANTADSEMTAYIEGLLVESTQNQDLFLKVVTPETNSMALSYVHPYDPRYKFNLSIRAANPDQQWDSASLFIDEGTITRTPTDFSSSISLQTLGDSGVSSIQSGSNLSISGGNVGYVNARPTLYMEGQPSVSVDEYTTLFIKTEDPTGSKNENIELFIENSQTTGTILNYNDSVPLYIINSIPDTTNATLFLKRLGISGGEEMGDDLNLTMKTPDSEGNLNLYSTATFSGGSSVNLTMPQTIGSPSGNINFMVRGYEE